ncbi:MAG: hypothetical protein ACK4PR_04480, partial [Gammaproteobacteria bacterium]
MFSWPFWNGVTSTRKNFTPPTSTPFIKKGVDNLYSNTRAENNKSNSDIYLAAIQLCLTSSLDANYPLVMKLVEHYLRESKYDRKALVEYLRKHLVGFLIMKSNESTLLHLLAKANYTLATPAEKTMTLELINLLKKQYAAYIPIKHVNSSGQMARDLAIEPDIARVLSPLDGDEEQISPKRKSSISEVNQLW